MTFQILYSRTDGSVDGPVKARTSRVGKSEARHHTKEGKLSGVCSLHSCIAKKYNALFGELHAQVLVGATEDSICRLKLIKQKAADDFMMLKGCPFAERTIDGMKRLADPEW